MQFVYTFLLLSTLSLFASATASATASDGSQLQIKTYRFKHHKHHNFERLVIEFKGNTTPTLSVTPNGNEFTLNVTKSSLVGAIPEANINDLFQKKSHFLGALAINTDMKEGFTIRTATKEHHHKLDIFWLQNPSRLVFDAYPEGSQRAKGPQILSERGTASFHTKNKKDLVFCFNSSLAVKANLAYESGDRFKGIPMTIDGEEKGEGSDSENIVCYPKSAQVMPKVYFSNEEKKQESKVEPAVLIPEVKPTKNLLPPTTNWEPPKSPKLPPTNGWAPPSEHKPASIPDKEAKLNKEADELLNTDDDRKTASTGQWEDNFNKNNPPPTLGKSLLPPVNGGGTKAKPQLANPTSPASLLPPIK